MRLEKLVLSGFKSFADKTTFEFNKNFTAIVGPNGSGKSNISDAIRWVLGETSLKLLRGKQAHDVIFSGSDKLARLGMAQVELHLTNNNGRFPLPQRDIVISRKLFRDGESEYSLNKAQVRLQDVIMLLAKAHFGQRSYSVIGQGMITHFLNASPQERKIFFDEATGVKEFQIKRDQSINKLIRTEEHLEQSELLIREIEPRLHSLSRQVKKFSRREKIEEQLHNLQKEYYGSRWQNWQTEILGLQKKREALNEQIEQIEREEEKAQSEYNKLAHEASSGERFHHWQQEYNTLLEHKSRLLKDQALVKGKLELTGEEHGQMHLVWLQRKKEELEYSLHAAQTELHAIHLQQEQNLQKQKHYHSQFTQINAELDKQRHKLRELQQNFEKSRANENWATIKQHLTDLFRQQENFLAALLKTQSITEFRVRQKEAQIITKSLGEIIEELEQEDKSLTAQTRQLLEQQEQEVEEQQRKKEKISGEYAATTIASESLKATIAVMTNNIGKTEKELKKIDTEFTKIEHTASSSLSKRQEQLNNQLTEYEKNLSTTNDQLNKIQKELDNFHAQEEIKKSALLNIQEKLQKIQRDLNSHEHERNTLEIQLVKIETQKEDLKAEIERSVPENLRLSIFNYHGETKVNEELRYEIDKLVRQLETLGAIDEETLAEHKQTKERYDFLKEQTTDLNKSIIALERIIDELDATIRSQFQTNFRVINDGFQEYFRVLFRGGKARLALMTEENDSENQNPAPGVNGQTSVAPLEEKKREFIGKKKKKQKIIAGIDVMACPPGKKIANVSALSGGEKSLVAIALLCAIIAHNPSPFVVLDEIEAALDEENSEKLVHILKNLAKKTQIVIITHNRVTMRAADVLYGVTMGRDGKSHVLSVELKEAEEMVE